MNVCYSNSLCLLPTCRHVKGRVLVALADGTLAIFHRSEGIWSFGVICFNRAPMNQTPGWFQELKKKSCLDFYTAKLSSQKQGKEQSNGNITKNKQNYLANKISLHKVFKTGQNILSQRTHNKAVFYLLISNDDEILNCN